jgi:endo-1,4-beta-xylanase
MRFEVLICALLLFAGSTSELTLRKAAAQSGLMVGTAVRSAQLSEPAYAATLAREFNMVEAEDAMKWWVLRPRAGEFDFREGDELVRFAASHGMKVRGHCLVWGRSNPDWLTQGHFSHVELSQMLHEHITRVMRHYAGQVYAWDVVNEGLDENGDVRHSIWYDEPGIGFAGGKTKYIEQAFRWAHESDPRALLFYNDAEGEALNKKSDAVYAMVKDLKRRGIPIDGVGLQMHIGLNDVNIPAVAANIARLAGLGVQVHITELDVSLPLDSNGQARTEDLSSQAEVYRGVIRACLNNAGCAAIQTWGFTDKYSWIGSHSRGSQGQALPFDRTYQRKAAYWAMLQEISAGRTTH